MSDTTGNILMGVRCISGFSKITGKTLRDLQYIIQKLLARQGKAAIAHQPVSQAETNFHQLPVECVALRARRKLSSLTFPALTRRANIVPPFGLLNSWGEGIVKKLVFERRPFYGLQ